MKIDFHKEGLGRPFQVLIDGTFANGGRKSIDQLGDFAKAPNSILHSLGAKQDLAFLDEPTLLAGSFREQTINPFQCRIMVAKADFILQSGLL